MQLGFDRASEVLAIEHGPAERRMCMFIKNDDNLRSTVKILMSDVKTDRVVEVLILKRPGLITHTLRS